MNLAGRIFSILVGLSLVRQAVADDAQHQGETPDEKARRGAMLYESPNTREEGLSLLQEAERDGSPFAKARIAAFWYLGEGDYEQDYEKALKLMKAAVTKGFPAESLPLAEAEEACARQREARKLASAARQKASAVVSLGDGYPGRLERERATPELQVHLDRYGLKAGWFRRAPDAVEQLKPWRRKSLLSNELPYLLFVPRQVSRPVPLLVYFGGTGEHGTNLVAQFHQTTIFRKVTSPEFQRRHPCYLFAPMLPVGSDVRCGKAWSPPMADLVCDAMYAIVREAKAPRIDTNRLYLTGLSYGGSAAYTFSFGYPGRFAAALPVAGFATKEAVPDRKPGNIWLLHNEHEYASAILQSVLSNVMATVVGRGGEFRVSTFPDRGHNAWDKAWQEDAVWDWMFSKTADGTPVKDMAQPPSGTLGHSSRSLLSLAGARCTASRPGRDDGCGPERAADGLMATCYVSDAPADASDWWQIDFAAPVSGRIDVLTGLPDGQGILTKGTVEVSEDGNSWRQAGLFRRSGKCRFPLRTPIRHLRVRPGAAQPQTLIVREVVVTGR